MTIFPDVQCFLVAPRELIKIFTFKCDYFINFEKNNIHEKNSTFFKHCNLLINECPNIIIRKF